MKKKEMKEIKLKLFKKVLPVRWYNLLVQHLLENIILLGDNVGYYDVENCKICYRKEKNLHIVNKKGE